MRPSARSVALVAGLYALALWLRLQLLPSAPYGDEGLHYWVARHFTAVPGNVSDVDGLTWFHPSWIFWQRPAYYLALHPFALQGFEAFRVGHALLCALLPVVAFGLLRAYGATRSSAFAAGLFAAAYTPFVTWGGLGLMDEPMTVAFAAGLWALRARRHLLAAALLVLAVWTKETAFIGLALLLAGSLLAGWVRGRNRLDPFELDRPTAALLLAALLALLPLQVALLQGLDTPGAVSAWRGPALADAMWIAPWLVPVLLLGLRYPSSRLLCGLALALGLALLVLDGVAHRAVEAWYLVQPAFLAGCGAIATADAAVRASRASGRPRAMPVAAALLVAAVVAGAVLLPASSAKALALAPFSRQQSHSLADGLRYETEVRDQDLLEAVEALALGRSRSRTVIAVDVAYPYDLYPLSERARHVYVDSAAVRDLAPSLGVERFAAAAAVEGTLILAGKTGFPFTAALDEAYGGCRVLDNAAYRVYESWRCPGGAEGLRRWEG